MNELNLNGFSELTEEEMMAIDGGGWRAVLCAVSGFFVGLAIGTQTGPIGMATSILLCTEAGYKIGLAWEN